MYKSHAGTDALQDRVFAYLREAHATNGTNVAFVDLHRCVARRANAHLERVFSGSGGPIACSRLDAHMCFLDVAAWGPDRDPRSSVLDFDFDFGSVKRLLGAILDDSGAFGYVGAGNATCLLSATSSVGGCDDPSVEVFRIRE